MVAGAAFGSAAALTDNYLLVGAPYDEDAAGEYTGSAFLFKKSGSGWELEEKFYAGDGSRWAEFGYSVGLVDGTAIVGAPWVDAAYFYDYPSKSLYLDLEPQVILLGESATLSWESSSIDTVTIDPGIGTVDPNGSTSVSPVSTTTYNASGSGPDGTVTAEIILYIVDPSVPPEAEVNASAETILEGDSVVLTWTATNATSVSIDPGIGTMLPSGTLTLSPKVTTTYEITATGPAGTTTVSVTVVVRHPPTIQLLTPVDEDQVAGACFRIRWDDDDRDSNASISLFYDTNNNGADGILIASGLDEDPDGVEADAYVWNTAGMPDHTSYYLYAVINDGVHDTVVAYSQFTVYVNHFTLPENQIPFEPEGFPAGSQFGSAVTADGDVAVVAANKWDYDGSVSIYRRECQNWVLEQVLTPAEADAGPIDEPMLNIVAADSDDGEALFTGYDRDYRSGEEIPIDFSG